MASIAGLLLPIETANLVVPAAMVAEIVSRPRDLSPLPAMESWVLGYFRWRNRPVTLVSFERLASDREVTAFSRACVFHPLPGRGPSDYFALAVSGDPRSVEIPDSAESGVLPDGIAPRFAAGALSVDGRTLVVPDLDTLKIALYPNEQRSSDSLR